MGQYYKIIILGENKDFIRFFINISYGLGLKLTEHSYQNINFLNTIEYLLSSKGSFYKSRIVWAGDYADSEENNSKNLYHITDDESNKEYVLKFTKLEDEHKYIVNHTKKQFIDKSKYKSIHPLPFITAEGNGRGGGDYYGTNEEFIGSWSRDIISMEKDIPDDFIEFEHMFDEY